MTTSNIASERPEPKVCTHLVVVCCHATYVGNGSNLNEDQWILQPFQRSDASTGRPSEVSTLMLHIEQGAKCSQSDPDTLLVFSGGRTTQSDRAEAEGYQKLALHAKPYAVKHCRYALETHATDSFQNLLFSIIKFKQVVGHYPSRSTVITHAFKAQRFLELHAAAIKWPADRIRIWGTNPPFTEAELQQTVNGEHERAYKLFVDDPYGARSPLLDKRLTRNWDADKAERDFASVEPVVQRLLAWNGGESGREIFPERLPWEDG